MDPRQDGVLRVLMPEARDAAERRRRARAHLGRVLARARQFHRAMDVRGTPTMADLFLVVGTGVDTPAAAVVDPGTGRASVPVMEDGDGVVLRASALSDERQGGHVPHDDRKPIQYRTVLLLPGKHVSLTHNPVPPELILQELRRRACCDFCGSLGGRGVWVDLVHTGFSTPDPTPAMVEGEHRRLREHREHLCRHPFGRRGPPRRESDHRPDPALLDDAHRKLRLPMCNLYSDTLPQDAMRRLFKARDRLGNQPPLPAIFPDMEAPIVRLGDDGEPELVRARWGWNKAKFGWVTNVRNLSGWPWKHVIQEPRQRCLVPATSFAEYHPTEKDAQGRKLAVWFRLVGDGERPPFAFAGFKRRWDWQKDGLRKKSDQALAASNAPTRAMAFLTCEPNGVVAPIHPKAMPVVLRPEEWETWLRADADEAACLQRPLPDDALEVAFVGEKEDAA